MPPMAPYIDIQLTEEEEEDIEYIANKFTFEEEIDGEFEELIRISKSSELLVSAVLTGRQPPRIFKNSYR